MRELINLVSLDKSDVKYTLSRFPDGEIHIKLDTIDRKKEYGVISRICNGDDLFLLMQVNDILTRQGVDWQLMIPYFMSMRMDRVISYDEAFSLKVVADIVKSFSCSNIGVFHPHSERTPMLLNESDCSMNSSKEIFDKSLYKVGSLYNTMNAIVCFPDAGAQKRYASQTNSGILYNPYICLSKKRDLNNMGAIMSIEIERTEREDLFDVCKNIIVIDDLCDAGGTFIGAANKLKEAYPDKKLSIFVRHLVNPKGIENLSKNYDKVYITNSYKDWENENLPENVKVEDVISYLAGCAKLD